jgi:hypothetical protein
MKWKPVPIPEYAELYIISDNGIIQRNSKTLKPQVSKRGYHIVKLNNAPNSRTYTVHKLVATAFIDNPDNLPQVNHIDSNKTNNNIANLEWVTNKDNCIKWHKDHKRRPRTKTHKANLSSGIKLAWDSGKYAHRKPRSKRNA